MRAILIVVAALIGCGQEPDPATGADAAPDAAPEPQGSPARGDLVINELAPQPTQGADWIELLNRSDQAIDLCAFFVTDSLDRLDHYTPLGGVMPPDPCEPSLLSPGAYRIIHADDSSGPDHALFRLGRADEVHVVATDGRATDSVIYLYPASGAGDSLARMPDGEGLFFLAPPSPGEPNPEELP